MYKTRFINIILVRCITILLLCMFYVCPIMADSWDNTSWDNTNYNTTEGTEFYATFLKNQGSTENDVDNLALYLHAAAEEQTNVEVLYLFDGSVERFQVNANSQHTISIDLSKAYVDFLQEVDYKNQKSRRGIYVTADKPISLYVTNSRDGAYTGTCILPTIALGTDYVVQTYLGDHESTMFAVVGTQDYSRVTLNIKKTELDKDLYQEDDIIKVDTTVYETFDVYLNKGDVFLYRSEASYKGLSGTSICSDKPIAVFNGHQAARIPYYDETLNHLSAQTYPIDRWGRRYVVTPTKHYINETEHVRLTAFYDGTKIMKNNGTILCTLNAFETYQDTINASAIYYESSQPIACFLYTLGRNAEGNEDNKSARPSMSPITPLEYATNSLTFATFTESNIISEQFVNIVVEDKYVSGLRLDGNPITSSFSNINIGGVNYKYTQIPISQNAHLLTNLNKSGGFTARVYGMGYKKGRGESYAYAAGSRISRKIDVLVDGKYILEKTICKGSPAIEFEGLVGFDLDSNDEVKWCIKEQGNDDCDTIIYENIDGEYIMSHYFVTDSVDKDFEVSLIVTKRNPSICDDCDYNIVTTDTVKVYIHLKTNYIINDVDNYCYGAEFTLHKDGQIYNLIADTVNIYSPLFSFPFKINTKYVVVDEQKTDFGCDSTVNQVFYIRIPDTTIVNQKICDNQLPYVWHLKPYTGTNDSIVIDTIRGKEVIVSRSESYNKYGCESLVTLNLHVYPSYEQTDHVMICQRPEGEPYTWVGHSEYIYDVHNNKKIKSNSIPTNIPGTYTYVDSLQTQCHDCLACDSIWILDFTVNPMYHFSQDTTISNEDYIKWQGMKIGGEDSGRDDLDVVITKNDTIYKNDTTQYGCDSIYVLIVHFGTVFRDTTYALVCANESEFIWNREDEDGNLHYLQTIQAIPTKDTIYSFIKKSPIGIDSIFYLDLKLSPILIQYDTLRVCKSDGFTSWHTHKEELYDKINNQIIKSDQIPTNVNGIYVDSTKNSVGCDSIWQLSLEVIDAIEIVDTRGICDNEYTIWNNKIYRGNKFDGTLPNTTMPMVELPAQLNYLDTIKYTSIQGCDSINILQLDIYPTYETTDTIIICDNAPNPFVWQPSDANGIRNIQIPFTPVPLPAGGTQKETIVIKDSSVCLQSVNGCDSIVNLYLEIMPTYTHTKVDTTCQLPNGTYMWENHPLVYSQYHQAMVNEITLDSAGSFIYVDSLKSVCPECENGGCDSLFILNLTVLPSYYIVDTVAMISDEEVFIWHVNGITYGGEHTALEYDTMITTQYPDTFVVEKHYQTDKVGTYSCDSVIALHLMIGKVTRDTTYASACTNEPYYWIGVDQQGQDSVRQVIYNPKDSLYIDKYRTAIGFDSVFYLDLNVHPAYVGIDSMTQYSSTCQNKPFTWNREGCSSMLYSLDAAKWINASAIPTDRVGTFIYVDSLQTKNHQCDSVWTLQLTIQQEFVQTDYEQICEDEYVIWQNRIYRGAKCADALPNDTMKVITLEPQLGYTEDTLLFTINGCDSTIYLHLDVHPIYSVVDAQTICDNENPYIWHTQDHLGSYTDTIVFTEQMMYVDPITKMPTKDSMIISDRYRILQTIHGCDSLVQLHLTINPTYLFVTEDTICSGDLYKWRGYSKYWTQSDTITDSLATSLGCDSLYQLRLYVKPAHLTHRFEYICDNQTLYFNTEIVWAPGMSKTDTLKDFVYTNIYDCDSTFRYHLTIMPTYKFEKDSLYTICSNEPFQLHDTYDPYKHIKYYDTNVFASIRDTLLTDTLTTITCPNCPGGGCDSIYTAHLRIYPAYKHIDYDTICSNDTLLWREKKCFNSLAGNYVYHDSLKTIHSCDSIYELQLRINQSYDIVLPSETICAGDSIFIADKYISKSGIYKDTLVSIDGCDSILYLSLTVYDTTSLILFDTICVTETYILDTLYSNILSFTEPGLYIDSSYNEWGCQHITYLNLEVVDTTKYTLEIGDICADEDYIWIHYTYSGLPLIEYSVNFDSLGLNQGFSNIYHAPLDVDKSLLRIPIPKGPVLPRPEPTYFDSQQGVNTFIDEDKYTYPRPDQYKLTIIMHNGICGDTLQRKDTMINILYPSWIHEQHWNDGIVLYNDTYNGGYNFTKYQWYQNGEPLIGQTNEYLYIPSQLLLNNRSECNNYYQVLLTREDDDYSTFTCPICPVYLPADTIVPRLDYFSIVPTLVHIDNPIVHILSTMPGKCMGYDAIGNQLFKPIDFVPDNNNYAGEILLPVQQSGIVYLRVSTSDGDSRIFKVLIR